MFFVLLNACTDTATLPSGELFALRAADDGTAYTADDLVGLLLQLDLDAATATFVQDDGAGGQATDTIDLVARDPADWETGCPTNYTHVDLETWDLDADAVTLGPVTVTAPIVTASCDSSTALVVPADGDATVYVEFSPSLE